MSDEGLTQKPMLTIKQLAIILCIAITVLPVFSMPVVGYTSMTGYSVFGYYLYTPLYPFYFGEAIYYQPTPFTLTYYISLLPFTGPLYLFVFGVVRYCQRRYSFTKLLFFAVLSILLPAIIMVSYLFLWMGFGLLVYAGPIPLHFIIAAILIRYAREEESVWID